MNECLTTPQHEGENQSTLEQFHAILKKQLPFYKQLIYANEVKCLSIVLIDIIVLIEFNSDGLGMSLSVTSFVQGMTCFI